VSNESLTGKAFALHSKAKKSPKVLDTNRRKIIVDKICKMLYYNFSKPDVSFLNAILFIKSQRFPFSLMLPCMSFDILL
jgi:hypothetical protein